MHCKFSGCCGGVGGVAHGGVAKLKNSVMSICAASRAVKGCNPKRVSMNFRMAVLSAGVCETKFFFVNGEITIMGTRKPVRVKPSGGWIS